MKKLVLLTVLGFLIMSCSTSYETFWVRGVKTDCDAGAGQMKCLNTYKGESLDEANWQTFYAPIEGFEFKEGVNQKIKVKREKLSKKDVPADASSYRYVLDKVIETDNDNEIMLEKDWLLYSVGNQPIKRTGQLPFIQFNLENKTVSGNDGCNKFSGPIEKVTSVYLNLGVLRATKIMCNNMDVPNAFNQALAKVNAYNVDGDVLSLYDENKNIVLSFVPKKDTGAGYDEINSEWDAVRINGNPINRMAKVPHVLISTTGKKIVGTNGCDTFSANISQVTDNLIKVANVKADDKQCKDMSVPEAFNRALLQALNYKVDGNKLMFYDANGEEVLAFINSVK